MRKLLLGCFVISMMAVLASAQTENCRRCDSNAQCQQYQPSGGCGCVSGYDPVRHGYRCAWCGVCGAGTCIYGCNGQWFPGNSAQPAPTLQSRIVAPAPFWATNAGLSDRIGLQSPSMAMVFDAVKDLQAKGMCNFPQGNVRVNGRLTQWFGVPTKTGGMMIHTTSSRREEVLVVEEAGWGLLRNGRVVVTEKLP